MKKKKERHRPIKLLMGLCLLMGLLTANAQNNYTISGNVKDKMNGETLFGTSIFLKGTTIGAITNSDRVLNICQVFNFSFKMFNLLTID